MDIVHKSWKITTRPFKKLLSRTMTHLLSRNVNREKFEVVNEGFLDSLNPLSEQPDVVIYSKQEKFQPVVAVEFCKADEQFEMILLAKQILQSSSLKEFFIFNDETATWFRIDKTGNEIPGSFSPLLSLDLKRMITIFPQEDILTKNISRMVS